MHKAQNEHGLSTSNRWINGTNDLVLQEYLRNYVNADQTDWADHISMAKFNYKNTKHSGTGLSPFMVVSGTEPLSPIDLALQKLRLKMEIRARSWRPSFF